jgi:drug/metabolite transporter (DMT)-like permease
MKTILVVALAAASAAVGESLLSFGMKKFGPLNASDPAQWLRLVFSVVTNPYVFLGVVFLAVFFFLYLAALSWDDLSYVLPFTALSYLFAACLAKYFLKEDVTWLRWVGTMVIVLGIVFVALDQKPKTAGQQATTHPVVEHGADPRGVGVETKT